jgi:hypothetical protein
MNVLKYLSTNNILHVNFWLKHYVLYEIVSVLALKYSLHHARQCCAHERMASCMGKSSVHFNKTWLWFRFTFVSLFTLAINTQPISLADPLTFLTWLTVLTVRAGYRYFTFQKHCMSSLHFLRNSSAGRSLLLYIPKTSI